MDRRKKARPAKRLLGKMRRWAAGMVGAGLSQLFGPRQHDAFGILMYHRVAPWNGAHPVPSWNVTPQRFREQLAGLLAGGFKPWTLRQAIACSRTGSPIPREAFVVTFDDGYENVFTWAFPILRALQIPATVFVATAYLNSPAPFPFDDWTLAGCQDVAPELWRPLSFAQCTQMLHSGLIDLGSHTHTHQKFHGRADDLHADLLKSQQELRRRFGLHDATFGFPYGIAGPELTAAARQSGLLCSLTTRGELVRPGSDPFTWGRFAVEQSDTAGTIAAQLNGWCSLSPKSWRRANAPGRG